METVCPLWAHTCYDGTIWDLFTQPTCHYQRALSAKTLQVGIKNNESVC